MIIEDLNESACIIKNIDIDTFNLISPKLCVKVPGAEFTPKYKIGMWDGLKRFYKLNGTNFMFPKGLVGYITKKLDAEKIEYEYNAIQYNIPVPTYDEFIEFVETLTLPFKPYDYQMKASYESIVDKRKTIVVGTSGGKSLIIYVIIRWMMKHGYKCVLIVPTIMLTTQMYEDFKSYGMEDMELVHLIGGDNKVKHFDKPVTISTWQSLIRTSELFEGVDCLMIDECHKSTADSFENIISPNATKTVWRIGTTGTLPKNLVDKMTMLSVIGASKKYVTPRQLIEMGLATEVQVKCLYFNYPMDERMSLVKASYQDEVKYLVSHQRRNTKIAQIALKISQEGNTIVLFDRVEQGENLAVEAVRLKYNVEVTKKELQDINNPYKIFLVTGSTKASVREEIRQLMEVETGIIMFGTSSILSTGVNIKRLKNLVFASGGKSSITINQSIGRLLRKHVSKEITTIWDVVDDLTIQRKKSVTKNHFYKHYEERLDIYSENEYNIIEKEIQV